METPPVNLARIKVQTARMLEIYSLLRKELATSPNGPFAVQDVARLHAAIATVRDNMRQLQAYLEDAREGSAAAAETQELDEILSAVLAWAQEEGE